jgi:hypothetical protein
MLCAALLFAGSAANAADNGNNNRGAVEQTGGNKVSQNPSLPKLSLNDAQREQVRQTLLTKHTEVEFKMKTTKPAKDFNPQLGAKLPSAVKPDGMPSELLQKVPQLRDYGYAKMKGQILIVDAMTGKIAEIISEKPAQTTGQQ